MALSAVLLVLLAGEARAQASQPLVGVVRDSAGRPVPGVDVRSGTRATETGPDGRFELTGVSGDPVRLRLRKVGFEPIEVQTPRDSASAAHPMALTMGPLVAKLGRVIVKGEPYDRKLWDAGYYQRQRASRGTFLDPVDVDFYRASGLPAMVRQEPRVVVSNQNDQQFALSTVAGRQCMMHVYIDGMYQPHAVPNRGVRGEGSNIATATGLRGLIAPADIYAVEIYPTDASVPTQYRRMGSAMGGGGTGARMPSPGQPMRTPAVSMDPNAPCGAIVIWRKPVYRGDPGDSTTRR